MIFGAKIQNIVKWDFLSYFHTMCSVRQQILKRRVSTYVFYGRHIDKQWKGLFTTLEWNQKHIFRSFVMRIQDF